MPYHRSFFAVSLCILGAGLLIHAYSFPSASKQADILIFSPHPDDAVLCCAGLIQRSLAQGKTVHVVDITDGDGYVDAAVALFNKPAATFTLRNMQQLGRTRAYEEIRAMNTLGVSRRNITFLGYPDGWLDEVYKNEDFPPFTNPFTGISRGRHGRPYMKQSVIADLTIILKRTQPKKIYVSGLTDTALDHKVTYRLVSDTLTASGFTGRLFTYTNHSIENAALPPPMHSVHLTNEQIRKKAAAIESYTSQLPLDGEYLRSFTRKEEMFY